VKRFANELVTAVKKR